MRIDFAHETRLYLGMYELELNRHLRAMCRPGTKSFDVGGQQGYDALVFAKLTGAPVVSFECEPVLVERMADSIALNPALAVLVYPKLAMVGTGTDGRTLSLDDYAETSFMPDFVKIDVEGAEADVLRGAQRILRAGATGLLVEVHSRALERECGQMLVDAGYRPRVVNQRTFWPENRVCEHNRWLVAPAGKV